MICSNKPKIIRTLLGFVIGGIAFIGFQIPAALLSVFVFAIYTENVNSMTCNFMYIISGGWIMIIILSLTGINIDVNLI